MATVKENLIAARALIDTPEKWGKEDYEPRPGCFCLAGAIAQALGVEASPHTCEQGPEYDALKAALPSGGRWFGPVDFNDFIDTTHADVMALFDRAIAAQDGKP